MKELLKLTIEFTRIYVGLSFLISFNPSLLICPKSYHPLIILFTIVCP